ncbi:transcription factor E2F7 [Narcine bancroftii]|uniref:transcription factor E2F7 n=1 Tax=Narcine bancroftii TaxID=1343680 RepID=UPI0038321A63
MQLPHSAPNPQCLYPDASPKMESLKLRDLLSLRKCDVAPHSLDEEAQNAQKENRFRNSPKTPVKTEASPSAVSRRKCCTPDRIQVTPSKHPDKSSPEPWSPMANLRMLISAASPDIRDREEKKELFRQIENERVGRAGNIQLVTVDEGAGDEFDQQRPSRKQKSLGLLCQKFLARYPNYSVSTEKTEISLDEVAAELGVERRRIYDIVNILESLQLVSRVAKNHYSWHGLVGLAQTLAALKRRGEQLGYAEQLTHIRYRELELDGEAENRRDGPQEAWARCQGSTGESTFPETKSKAVPMNSRKDKSLRIMSEKFVMLFLVADPGTIGLDAAAKILIDGQPDSVDNSKFKTKIRRLYDIANVLTSLGLIKKVHVNERGRKPAFQWVGPVHQSRPDGRNVDVEDPSCKMAQLAAACRLQFEEDVKNLESHPKDGTGRPEVSPSIVTTAASSADSLAKPASCCDQLWQLCLPNSGKGSILPLATASGTEESYSSFHRNQPLMLLQSLPSAPVLLVYGNADPTSEPLASERDEVLPFESGPQRAGNSCKRGSGEQHPVCCGHAEDGSWNAKRQKVLCSAHDSGESASSETTVDKETQQHKTSGSIHKCPDLVSRTCDDEREVGIILLSTGTQTEETQNFSKALGSAPTEPSPAGHHVNEETRKPLSNGLPRPFLCVKNGQSALPANSQCSCLPAASGLSDVNLLLSTAPSQGPFTIPISPLAPSSLHYQLMVPVLCQTLPTTTTTSAGGCLHLGLPGLGLIPAAQLLVGGLPVSPPGSPAPGSSSPESQICTANLPSKVDPPALQHITVLKLVAGDGWVGRMWDHGCAHLCSAFQSPVTVAPKDAQQTNMETYFHTPVPLAQVRQLEGVQVKTPSPAQRKLKIENGLTK